MNGTESNDMDGAAADSRGPNTGVAAKPKRGRKPAQQSRSAEIRQRIAEWKSVPPEQRYPLTKLAQALGISHQLASYYASGAPTVEEIEFERQRQQYDRRAREIIERVLREGRVITPTEREDMLDCHRASLRAMAPLLWRRFSEDLTEHGASPSDIKFLRRFAKAGNEWSEKAEALLSEVRVRPRAKARKRCLLRGQAERTR